MILQALTDYYDRKIIKVRRMCHINGKDSWNMQWRYGVSPDPVLTSGDLSPFQSDNKRELAKGQGDHGKGGAADSYQHRA